MPPKFPVKVFYPRPNGEPKVLSAKDQDELEGLERVGWKVGDGKS